jgi:hypothetical protein
MVYQPPIENYTQTIHQRMTGSMLGDFILSFKPKDQPIQLEAIKAQLSTDEEAMLMNKAAEIVHYHSGADETTLMTGLLPYLSEKGLLARLARFDLRLLLENGQFVYLKSQKKWYTKEMVDISGSLKPMDQIPAEHATQQLIFSYLQEKKQATLDELLQVVYTSLVNAHRPQMSTVSNVINKYCAKLKAKGTKREIYIWNPKAITPIQENQIRNTQTALEFDKLSLLDHNTIIQSIAQNGIARGLSVHVGLTEQRKSPDLAALSINLSGLEIGLSPKAFKYIQEIDAIILRDNNILAAIEVAITISTFNKAINDRFRNLLTLAPNLKIKLAVVVNNADYEKARAELSSPANKDDGFAQNVKLWRLADLTNEELFDWIIS